MRVLLFLLFLSPALWAGSLEEVLDKHARTLGDPAAWRALEYMSYLLDITEPDFHLKGIYRVTRSGSMRIDIYAEDTRVFTEAFDGNTAWQWSSGDTSAAVIDGEKRAALQHGIEMPGHLYTLLDMQARGQTLEYLGDDERLGERVHMLKLTLKDGHEKYYAISRESGQLLAARDHRAFHPDLDQAQVIVESQPLDFREVGGIRKNFRTDNRDITNNKHLGTTLVEELDINTPIDPGYFGVDAFERDLGWR